MTTAAADSNGALPDDYNRDPNECNAADECHPFGEVKDAAISFIDRIIDSPPGEESDRLGLVFFSNGWESRYGQLQGDGVGESGLDQHQCGRSQPCEQHAGLLAQRLPRRAGEALRDRAATTTRAEPTSASNARSIRDTGDPSSCTTTNIGGGLRLGAQLFNFQPKDDALWIIVLLTDGAANASDTDVGHPYGYCPGSAGMPDWVNPFCRDNRVLTRHNTSSGSVRR